MTRVAQAQEKPKTAGADKAASKDDAKKAAKEAEAKAAKEAAAAAAVSGGAVPLPTNVMPVKAEQAHSQPAVADLTSPVAAVVAQLSATAAAGCFPCHRTTLHFTPDDLSRSPLGAAGQEGAAGGAAAAGGL